MKKYIALILAAVLLLSLSACGSKAAAPEETTGIAVDIDLTAMSSTMVFAEVFNMTNTPQDYVGKTVKMQGRLSVFTDEHTGNNYYAVVIADAAACCAQGMEFVPAEGLDPADFPEADSEVTVIGEFQVYTQDMFTFCLLENAVWA